MADQNPAEPPKVLVFYMGRAAYREVDYIGPDRHGNNTEWPKLKAGEVMIHDADGNIHIHKGTSE